MGVWVVPTPGVPTRRPSVLCVLGPWQRGLFPTQRQCPPPVCLKRVWSLRSQHSLRESQGQGLWWTFPFPESAVFATTLCPGALVFTPCCLCEPSCVVGAPAGRLSPAACLLPGAASDALPCFHGNRLPQHRFDGFTRGMGHSAASPLPLDGIWLYKC